MRKTHHPSSLETLKGEFETHLQATLLNHTEESELRASFSYALMNGGKRIRPLITMIIAKALGNHLSVLEASLSVEYFHTASLIADDLPCMDNDEMRRCKPALHKEFGETVAILTSYALISAGYEKILHASRVLEKAKAPFNERKDLCCVAALREATHAAGISGAVGGQFQDLFPQSFTEEAIEDLIYKKTVTLFEIAFAFGWIFGGGELSQLHKVRALATHFGMAFQIWDDLKDMKEDWKVANNMASLIGEEKAKERVGRELELFKMKASELGVLSTELKDLLQLLS